MNDKELKALARVFSDNRIRVMTAQDEALRWTASEVNDEFRILAELVANTVIGQPQRGKFLELVGLKRRPA